jgi:hypothetical protein
MVLGEQQSLVIFRVAFDMFVEALRRHAVNRRQIDVENYSLVLASERSDENTLGIGFYAWPRLP